MSERAVCLLFSAMLCKGVGEAIFSTENSGKSERSTESPLFPIRERYRASFITFFVCHTDSKAKIE